MYRAAILEDEKIFCENLEKSCRNIFSEFNIEHHISLFNNSADLLTAFSTGQRFDLLLLDIVMDNGISGMELARVIRNTDRDAAIIFITSHKSFALEGYDVKALHYLMKPVDIQALTKLIISDYTERFKRKYIILEKNSQKVRIDINDIISLETVGRNVAVTLQSGVLTYPGKLSELLEKLPEDDFVRCHQAYAINLQNIRELNRQNAIALNNKIVPISRVHKNEVRTAFLKSMNTPGR